MEARGNLRPGAMHCTLLYPTVLYCILLSPTVPYCTGLYCTVLHCTVLHCTVLLLYWTALHSNTLPRVPVLGGLRRGEPCTSTSSTQHAVRSTQQVVSNPGPNPNRNWAAGAQSVTQMSKSQFGKFCRDVGIIDGKRRDGAPNGCFTYYAYCTLLAACCSLRTAHFLLLITLTLP